jgi:hypothetical protein
LQLYFKDLLPTHVHVQSDSFGAADREGYIMYCIDFLLDFAHYLSQEDSPSSKCANTGPLPF